MRKWLTLVSLLVGASHASAQITPVHTFTNGTIIQAPQVNANFALLGNALNRTGGTMTGTLLFSADNTHDIGASGATRPRDLFLGRHFLAAGNATITGTLGVSGATTLAAFTASGVATLNGGAALTGTVSGSPTASGNWVFAGTSTNTSVAINADGATNAFRWGHANSDYLNTLGSFDGGGAPFICFWCYHGPTLNTLRRSSGGIPAAVLTVDGSANLTYGTGAVGTINTDFTPTARFAVNALGDVTAGTRFVSQAGTAGAPSYTFAGNTGTGMYSRTTNVVSFAAGATQSFEVASSGAYSVNGSAALPSYSFLNDVDTGMFYDPGLDNLVLAHGGSGDFRLRTISSTSMQFDIFRGGGTHFQLLTGPGKISMAAAAYGTGAVTGAGLSLGRNASGGTAASHLQLEEGDGGDDFLWIDNTGLLRIGTAAPEEDGTPAHNSGTVVGDQTSTRSAKAILRERRDFSAMLREVVRAPLFDFTYRDGRYNGEQFTGITTTDSPLFGKDQGKALNEVTAIGYLMGAVKALEARVRELEAQQGAR